LAFLFLRIDLWFNPLRHSPAQLPRGCYFFLIKSNQKSSQQKGFLALQAIARKLPKPSRAGIFLPGYPVYRLPCMQNFLCPIPML